MSTKMKVEDYVCRFHLPPGLKQQYDSKNNEIAQQLPPGCPVVAAIVDEYQACPTNWMHGSSRSSSYFVPVEAGRGLWFDFNENIRLAYDVAVVVSIQGINAITGQKTGAMRLEQYKDKCPLHDKDFGHNRFCEECGYQWPAQNYLSSNVQSSGNFWLDGFRCEDGVVRQYLISEEESRGVAAQSIGEERVFAIGIAFFRSKKQKPTISSVTRRRSLLCANDEQKTCGGINYTSNKLSDSPKDYCSLVGQHTNSNKSSSVSYKEIAKIGTVRLKDSNDFIDLEPTNLEKLPLAPAPCLENTEMDFDQSVEVDTPVSEPIEIVTKKLEIAAGAKIHQQIYTDPNNLNHWEEAPSLLYINYVSLDVYNKILEAGRRDLNKSGESWLHDMKVGN